MTLGFTLLALLVSAPAGSSAAPVSQEETQTPALELHEVVRVIDGDTIHIARAGELVKLRLLSVDTEEKLSGRPSTSSTKPETLYGEECARWAQAFIADLSEGEERPRVGLLLPGGKERYDVYGRLLCHVLLPDGTDFNLLLVKTGRSPYFNKYGNSLIAHEQFVAAQAQAREDGIGIWDPATNTPATEGAPAARRPYDQLLPWWDARAEAIDGFRARSAAAPERHVAADDPLALARGLQACAADPQERVEVFGTIDRFFNEDDGSLTALFRSGSKSEAFRASIPASVRPAVAGLKLKERSREFRQNYLSVTGHMVRGPRGFRIVTDDPDMWRVAGPEPD